MVKHTKQHGTVEFKESVNILAELLDAAPGAITVHDMSGRFLYTNQKNLDLHGYEMDEFMNLNLHDVDVPESEALINERIEKIRKNGEATFTVHHFRKDGSIIPLEIFTKITKWGDQPVLLSIATDISERFENEKAVRESEEKYRNLVNEMQSGLALHEIILDENGIPVDYRFLDVNPAFERLTGLKKENILGKTVLEVLPQTEKFWIERYGQVALTGESVEFEEYAASLDRYYSVVAYRPKENQFAVIVHEITERRRAEEKLKDNLALLRIAGEVTKLGGWNVNLEENRSYWSDVVAKIHEMPAGYAPMLEDGINFYAPEWRDKITKVFTDCATKGIPYNEKMEIITSTGKRVWIKTIGEAVRNEKGEIFKVHGGFQDISEEVAAEIEKEKLTQQLVQAQKMESIGRLAGGVAHDFNNMLSVIIGRVELALMKTGSENPVFNELVEIQNAAERSAALIKQLLAFARKQVISPKILDVNENVEKILVLVKRLISENVELKWIPQKKVWNILMDPTQLDQIFTNLCINAKDAMSDGGTITISAENVVVYSVDEDRPGLIPGDFVKISVEDNGHGMDKETASQIFEPFFTTKEHGKGTGLGLATVFGIVKQNNGYVYCFSEEGVGTRFEIYFHKKDAKNKAAEVFEKPICIKGEESITILLVEDEPTILEMSRSMLQIFGYTVISAGSPQEALKKSLEHSGKIDLLITDVIMPEMNGRELSKKIISHHPGVKCLFMSGYTAEVIAYQGVIDEDMNFIQKPFTMKTLGEKVKTVIGVK
jgi:PAS domain S-box-containing protein